MPKVSLLIPTYNYARYLPEAIESVLSQDFEDYEIVILDDCSTDDSRAVIESFVARDPRIRGIVNEQNLGMVPNWNACIELAKGQYLKFLFGDDKLAHPAALGQMVELLAHDDSVRLVGGARRIIDENSLPVGQWDYGTTSCVLRGIDVIANCLNRGINLIGEPSAVLFRAADAGAGFNPRFRQLVDLEMWLRLLEHGDFGYIAEACCEFRRHPAQQTEANRASGIGIKEHYLLLQEYSSRPEFPVFSDRVLFRHAYRLRKLPSSQTAEIRQFIQSVERTLGARYYTQYLRHKLTRPFSNLWRSVRRRLEGDRRSVDWKDSR